MKKIILSTIILLTSAICYSQFPQKRIITNSETIAVAAGAIRGDSGVIIASFLDTLHANINPGPKFYPGNLMRVGDVEYMRNQYSTRWVSRISEDDTSAMLLPYLRGATEGFGIDITGSQHKTWSADTTSGGVASWVRLKKIIDSLSSSGWGATKLNSILAADGTNTINNVGHAQEWQWNSLAGASGFHLSSNSTAAASNSQRLFRVTLNGANSNASQDTYSGYFQNLHTGTSASNYAVFGEAGGAPNFNYGVYGKVSSGDNGFAVVGEGNAGTGVVGSSSGVSTYGVQGSHNGSTGTGYAVFGGSTGAKTNGYGGYFSASDATNNYGIRTISNGTSTNNYGAWFDASGATNNYGLIVNSGNIGFGTATPSSKALLELSSTTQGFLPSRMTATQRNAITSPGAANFLWDTDSSRYMGYTGSAWKGIAWTGEGGGGTPTVRLNELIAANGTNAINNGNNAQEWQWNTLAGTSALKLTTTSTAAASNAQRMLHIDMSGTNSTTFQNTYGVYSLNQHGGSGQNIAGFFRSINGFTNYGIWAEADFAIRAIGGTGLGLQADVTTGTALSTTTNGNGLPLKLSATPSTGNVIYTMADIERTAASPADGIGCQINLRNLTSTSPTMQTASSWFGRWQVSNNSTRSSQTGLTAVTNAVTDTAMTLGGYVDLTEATATQFTTTTLSSGSVQGGTILITVRANDATDFQSRTLRFIWSAVNKAGTLTITLSTPEEVVAVSSGTLTVTITAVDNGSGVLSFKADATSSLTQTTLRCTYQTFKNF